MDAPHPPLPVLHKALQRLLRPLCRLLLRHAVSFRSFEELAKRTYVEVAFEELAAGKRVSASRVAVVSGLTRKELQRLAAENGDDEAPVADRYNRATRVMTGWLRDRDFHDRGGRPRPLRMDDEMGFAELVRRYSGDMPPRAVLDELLRVGAVQADDQGWLEPADRAYVPHDSLSDKLQILGHDVADLIGTIDHNLQYGASDPRFQRKVMYDAIPRAALPTFRRLSAERAQALLEELDSWLAARDLDNHPADTPQPRARVGMGIYYFEEALEADVVEGEKK